MTIVFVGPGWLCQDYWTKCVTRNADLKCIEWNPFYTDQVYQTDTTVSWWKSKNLSADDFNQDDLKSLNCIMANKMHVDNCNLHWSSLQLNRS